MTDLHSVLTALNEKMSATHAFINSNLHWGLKSIDARLPFFRTSHPNGITPEATQYYVDRSVITLQEVVEGTVGLQYADIEVVHNKTLFDVFANLNEAGKAAIKAMEAGYVWNLAEQRIDPEETVRVCNELMQTPDLTLTNDDLKQVALWGEGVCDVASMAIMWKLRATPKGNNRWTA